MLSGSFGVRKRREEASGWPAFSLDPKVCAANSSVRAMIVLGILACLFAMYRPDRLPRVVHAKLWFRWTSADRRLMSFADRGTMVLRISLHVSMTLLHPLREVATLTRNSVAPVARLTDAKLQFHVAVHHQYSTISAVNQDSTRVMLITESGQGVIVDMSGNVVIEPRDFPAINTGNVPWARKLSGGVLLHQWQYPI